MYAFIRHESNLNLTPGVERKLNELAAQSGCVAAELLRGRATNVQTSPHGPQLHLEFVREGGICITLERGREFES